MQTTNDIFVNPSVIKAKIAGTLVDDTEQVSGKTKLLGVEMATAQRTRPRAVVGAPRRAAWQLKSAIRHSISAAYKNFFTFFLQLLLVIFSL